MLLKTSELTGPALDWAVAKVLGLGYQLDDKYGPMCFRPVTTPGVVHWDSKPPPYSTDWAQGGPILSEARISRTIDHSGLWIAYSAYNYSDEKQHMQCHNEELVAGLRCFVTSKLGDEVDVPKELL